MNYSYILPAVKGIQANKEYFVCMVPLFLLVKIFNYQTDDVDPEYRAQRRLNEQRIPEIKDYILKNRNSYVFSALCASFDGEYRFESLNELSTVGNLVISTSSKFLINDGQHRRAAIMEALLEDPSLKNETISIVMYKDRGLTKSQQMFTDLNKHAVNTTKSLNALYDSNDPVSVLTRKVVNKVSFLKKYTDKEKDNLGKFSSNLFTLNNIVNANKTIVKNHEIDDNLSEFVIRFWKETCENIYLFEELEKGNISKKELREKYIVTQGVTISAFGCLGHFILDSNLDIDQSLKNLKLIDWERSNKDWLNKAINKKGRIVKNHNSINLTYLKIKELLKLNLTDEEAKVIKKARLN